MQRRRVLIGTGSAVAALVAGCSGEESDAEPPETDGSETETATDSESQTATTRETESDESAGDTDARLAAAAEDIRSADAELEAESDKFTDSSFGSGGGIDVETATTERYLDDASAELDAAEPGATGTQQQSIDAARNWISFARESIAFIDQLADGYNELGTGFTYFESERYTEASDTFETAEDELRDADSQLTIVEDRQTNLSRADSDAFDDVDLTSAGSGESIAELSSLLSTLIPFTTGFSELSLGLEDFTAGTETLEREQFTAAESAYEDAEDHFTTAESLFRGLEDSAPSSVRNSIIEISCIATAFKDGAGHFATGAGYYAAGDTRAGDREFNAGQTDLERCDFEA